MFAVFGLFCAKIFIILRFKEAVYFREKSLIILIKMFDSANAFLYTYAKLFVKGVAMDIGAKIRSLRLQRGLTQEELASRCELTKGYISQLENDIASPSITTLIDILNVLGIKPQDFFAEDDKNEKIVFAKKDFFESECGDGKIVWLIPNSQKNDMEPIILILPPEGESYIRYPFEGQEFGYVLEGKIEIITGEESTSVHQAKKGEAFYIDGAAQHKIRNAGSSTARIIWVTTPSNF